MPVFVVSGDQTLLGLELGTLLDDLVGDGDRALLVEDFDVVDVKPDDRDNMLLAISDAMITMPLITDRRIVVVRNVHDLDAECTESLAQSVGAKADTTDVVLTISGRVPKVLNDALKVTGATTIGATVGTRSNDRLEWVESHAVEEAVSLAPDAVRRVEKWLGSDVSKLAGLLDTLKSTFGSDKKISRDDVEPFLGEAGSVMPWDLTDAIESGNTSLALANLHRMIDGGNSHPFQILAMLGNRYAQMMRLDGTSVQTSTDAAQLLGVKEFPARKILEEFRRIGSDGIANALKLLAAADVDLRGGKDWEPEWVMEVLVARLSRLGAPSPTTQRRKSTSTSRR